MHQEKPDKQCGFDFAVLAECVRESEAARLMESQESNVGSEYFLSDGKDLLIDRSDMQVPFLSDRFGAVGDNQSFPHLPGLYSRTLDPGDWNFYSFSDCNLPLPLSNHGACPPVGPRKLPDFLNYVPNIKDDGLFKNDQSKSSSSKNDKASSDGAIPKNGNHNRNSQDTKKRLRKKLIEKQTANNQTECKPHPQDLLWEIFLSDPNELDDDAVSAKLKQALELAEELNDESELVEAKAKDLIAAEEAEKRKAARNKAKKEKRRVRNLIKKQKADNQTAYEEELKQKEEAKSNQKLSDSEENGKFSMN